MITLGENALHIKPFFSIILPVYNETERINETISHLRVLHHTESLEIIVVDGDNMKSTITSIRDRRVIAVTSDKGRARQMNRGASLASGDVLIFLHADTFLPIDALSKISIALNDVRCMAGAFDLGINSSRGIFRITERYVALRTRLTRIPFGDQAIFVRRAYFEQLGGYRDLPLMEDVELMKRIRKRGDLIRIIPDKVMTSPRRWEQEGILYCTFRNWTLQLLYSCGVSPEQLVKFYRS